MDARLAAISGGSVGKRNGKVDVKQRMKESKDFIYQWASEKTY